MADAWTSITRKLPVMAGLDPYRDAELADFAKMDEIRRRVDDLMSDPVTAEALKSPSTNQGGNSIVCILEAGAPPVGAAVARIARRGGSLDVRPEAEKRYNEQLSADLDKTIWTRCDSYFRSPSGRIVTQWPYTELDYARRTRRLRHRDWIRRDQPGGGAGLAAAMRPS